MKEEGRIVALGDDCIWVETSRQSTCTACTARKGCGQTLLNRIHPGYQHFVRVLLEPGQRQGLEVGDRVEVSVPDDVVLKASLIVYFVPLLLLLVGTVGAGALFGSDAYAVAGAAAGLACGAALVRLHAHLTRNDRRIQPRLVGLAGVGNVEPVQVV